MPHSIREQILQAITGTLAPVAAAQAHPTLTT